MKLTTLPPSQPDVQITLSFQEAMALLIIAGNADASTCYDRSSRQNLTTRADVINVSKTLFGQLDMVARQA
jgi:hypothetical protein